MISSETASQEEQNGANFSFIAPSSRELLVQTLVKSTHMVKVVTVVDRKCLNIITSYVQCTVFCCRKGLDVDEVTIDPSANWVPVEKPKDMKDEDGT